MGFTNPFRLPFRMQISLAGATLVSLYPSWCSYLCKSHSQPLCSVSVTVSWNKEDKDEVRWMTQADKGARMTVFRIPSLLCPPHPLLPPCQPPGRNWQDGNSTLMTGVGGTQSSGSIFMTWDDGVQAPCAWTQNSPDSHLCVPRLGDLHIPQPAHSDHSVTHLRSTKMWHDDLLYRKSSR